MKHNNSGSHTPVRDAVILAAGRGSRLKEYTDDGPKCLVEIDGQSLLENQIEMLKASGIERLCVVAGYQAQAVENAVGSVADIIYNDKWASTNSLYSLWLCHKWIQDQVMILNCDVLVHPEAIRRLTLQSGNAFLYDSKSGDDDEEMKVELKNGCLQAMSKSLPAERVSGENVGILLFDTNTVRFLFQEAEAALRLIGPNHWQAAAVERVSEFLTLCGVDICDLPWIEIDFPPDLEKARRETWPAIQALSIFKGQPRHSINQVEMQRVSG